MTLIPDKRLATGAPEVSIEGKLPHFDTGIVPVRRSLSSNWGWGIFFAEREQTKEDQDPIERVKNSKRIFPFKCVSLS